MVEGGATNRKLTPKERLFVAEYLNSLNATQAAIKAGYSKKSARRIATKKLSKAHIQEAIMAARNSIEKREEKTLMEAREVEEHLDAIIRFNLQDYVNLETDEAKPISELSREAAGCIAEFTTIESPLGSQRKLKFFNKLEAIKAKMQRLGLMKNKIDVAVKSYEQHLRERIEERKAQVKRIAP